MKMRSPIVEQLAERVLNTVLTESPIPPDQSPWDRANRIPQRPWSNWPRPHGPNNPIKPKPRVTPTPTTTTVAPKPITRVPPPPTVPGGGALLTAMGRGLGALGYLGALIGLQPGAAKGDVETEFAHAQALMNAGVDEPTARARAALIGYKQ